MDAMTYAQFLCNEDGYDPISFGVTVAAAMELFELGQAKSPLTGVLACSNSGGFIGNELKNAGWDMIIFEGKSPEPVYLYLENEKAELVPAAPGNHSPIPYSAVHC